MVDISQIDLPRNVKSGLIDAQEKLKNIHQIDFVHFQLRMWFAIQLSLRLFELMNPLQLRLKKRTKRQNSKRAVQMRTAFKLPCIKSCMANLLYTE